MNEIKVEPYIPDEDYDNPAMVVDFYEFTMANCLFLHGFKDTTLVFDMFFRKNPDNQGYSISAGQRKLTRFLLDYHFNEQDIHWLRTKGMSEEFCEYLRTYKWKGDMYALPEGTVCYPHVQMVRIECDLVGAILIETYLLQTMNFHSLIATKATRVTGLNTHTPRSVMEFGTRRAQGESAGNDGAYAAVLGGCIGTANCLAEMKFGAEVKAVGTVAHSFITRLPPSAPSKSTSSKPFCAASFAAYSVSVSSLTWGNTTISSAFCCGQGAESKSPTMISGLQPSRSQLR